MIALITTSPYLIRNIIVFEKVTITKSFGYNLWKGNNPKADVEGNSQIENELKEKIKLITKNKNYGIAFDNIFLASSIGLLYSLVSVSADVLLF